MTPTPADALSQSIDRMSAAACTTATGEDWPWLFTRCWMLANRFDHHGRAPADLTAAHADFARLPKDAPGRARLAAVLVNMHLRDGGRVLRTPEQIEPVAELAAVADGDPAPFPQWPADRSLVRAVWLMISLQYGRAGVDGRSALAEIEQLAEVVGTTQPHATMIEYPRLVALHFRTRDDRDLPGVEQLVEQVDRLGAGADPLLPDRTADSAHVRGAGRHGRGGPG